MFFNSRRSVKAVSSRCFTDEEWGEVWAVKWNGGRNLRVRDHLMNVMHELELDL